MKKIKLILVLLLATTTLVSFNSSFHEFYISITSIDYNSKSKQLEITTQFTTHDIEKAIFKRSEIELKLASKKEHPKADSLIFDYISSKFQLSTNKNITLHFIGKEVNLDETMYVYMESKKLSKPKELQITNTVLTEVFNSQTNITHVNFGKIQQSFSFNKEDRIHTFKIN